MTIKANQSILDIALQTAGTVDAVFELIRANDYAIGFEYSLEAGTEIRVPMTYTTIEPQIVKYFFKNRIEIATDYREPVPEPDWILADGMWNDAGVWKDREIWRDFADRWLLEGGKWNDGAFFIDTYNWNDN